MRKTVRHHSIHRTVLFVLNSISGLGEKAGGSSLPFRAHMAYLAISLFVFLSSATEPAPMPNIEVRSSNSIRSNC